MSRNSLLLIPFSFRTRGFYGIIKDMHTKPTSAYVHIPFCTQICFYCDFSKVFIKNQPVDAYLDHLIQEFRREEITHLRTLYIGVGHRQPYLQIS